MTEEANGTKKFLLVNETRVQDQIVDYETKVVEGETAIDAILRDAGETFFKKDEAGVQSPVASDDPSFREISTVAVYELTTGVNELIDVERRAHQSDGKANENS